MKRIYIAPEVVVSEFDIKVTLMSVSAGGSLDDTNTGGSGSGMDADGTGRRGSWGDLWD